MKIALAGMRHYFKRRRYGRRGVLAGMKLTKIFDNAIRRWNLRATEGLGVNESQKIKGISKMKC